MTFNFFPFSQCFSLLYTHYPFCSLTKINKANKMQTLKCKTQKANANAQMADYTKKETMTEFI